MVWFSCTATECSQSSWRPYECVWCPSRNRLGLEGHYRIVRDVRMGDIVLVAPRRILLGVARAASEAGVCTNVPAEVAGQYPKRPIMRIPLVGYQAFSQPLELSTLFTDAGSIVREIEEQGPKYYLFSWERPNEFRPRGRLQFAQGRFLSPATTNLLRILRAAMSESSRNLLDTFPATLGQHSAPFSS